LCRDEAATEDVVAAAISAVDGRRERGGFTISVSLPDTVLPVVCIDVQAMTQVFVNLLDNAMKYSGRSRRILVSLSQRNADVVVSVTDFGIGIEPDDHERIFQQFYRTAVALNGTANGTGLGLAIVRRVVQSHGGSIAVNSRIGRGACFTVRIPIAGTAKGHASTGVSTSVDGVGLRAGAEA